MVGDRLFYRERCANGRVIIRVHGRYDVCSLFKLNVIFPCNSVGGSGIRQGLVIPALPANHSQPLVASALALSRCDRNSYILTGNSVAGQDSGPKKGKDKKRKRGPEKETNAKEDSAPASKKLQKGKGTTSGSGDTKPRFSKDQMDEALKGVPQNLRDARDKKNMCRRCGLDNHRWQWCRKEISVSSTRKKKDKKESKGKDTSKKETSPAPAASSLKRKAPTNTVSVGVHSLPCAERILANLHWKAGSSKRARVASAVKAEGSSDSEEEPKRVWEINSEEERNM